MSVFTPKQKHDPAADPAEGFGQSLLDDLRFMLRFHRCRALAVTWRAPEPVESRHWDSHPLFGRFGDETIAVTEIDGRRWLVRERTFWGWPDPPRWVFFAVDADDAVWCARDFNAWPRSWHIADRAR